MNKYTNSDYRNSGEDRSWYVLYTVVRHEKAVNLALKKKNIESFLPLRRFVSRWKDRKKEVKVPLFPGYLFINANHESIYESLNTRSVVKVLGNSKGPTPIPNEQIDGIKKLIESNLVFNTHALISVGKEVVVTNGPLEGFIGKVIEKRGNYKLILSVDLIRRSISLEVNIDDVELM